MGALFAVKDSFNSYPADLIAQKIGEIAISDTEYYRVITEKIVKSRESLSQQLRGLGWNVLPSGANFIFAEKEGLSGDTVYNALKKEGILVRHFNMEGIRNFVRITIGTDEDMEALMKSVRALF